MANIKSPKVSLFWFRRDLRLSDNAGLYHALKNSEHVLPIFIFDSNILSKLKDKSDARVGFIYDTLAELKSALNKKQSDILVRFGDPIEVYKKLFTEYQIDTVYTNHDYEPYARERDQKVAALCKSKNIQFLTFKDQTLFEKEEILTDMRKPYTVYTPYKKKVLAHLSDFYLKSYPVDLYEASYLKVSHPEKMLEISDLGFQKSTIEIPKLELSQKMLKAYSEKRDFPFLDGATSRLGVHLRFGTVSVRELAREGKKYSDVWLSELIWRDFFMQIMWHYPQVEKQSFRPDYDKIAWRDSEVDFQRWCSGNTGYPLVDAGMRELNATGHMHNRVRMVVASFLCKHLLIHWHKGERYFAEKLLDFDLSANNGNWQWAAGSGCDAAPYFRIFNPTAQAEKFDPDEIYIRKWVPEVKMMKYAKPMVEHVAARDRCLKEFNKVLKAGAR